MQHKAEFVYLSMDVREKKNSKELNGNEKYYSIVNFLDDELKPCKFFVFNTEILEKLLDLKLSPMSKVNVDYEVIFQNNLWNVRLLGMEVVEDNE